MIAYLEILLLSFVGLFLFYVAVMEIKVEVENTRFEPYFRYTVVPVFLVADWLVNLIISPAFLDLPATPFELVTARMKRYKRGYPIGTWRNNFAWWLCRHLNRHDKGHC